MKPFIFSSPAKFLNKFIIDSGLIVTIIKIKLIKYPATVDTKSSSNSEKLQFVTPLATKALWYSLMFSSIPICDSKFAMKSSLDKHVRCVHEKKKPHKCTICERSFGENSRLVRHIETVHEKIKISCEICFTKFSSKSALRYHVNSVHEDNNPHVCSICDKKFPVKNRLDQHIERVHDKKNRKQCPLCEHTAVSLSNLRKHIASIHEGKNMSWRKKYPPKT